jgi:hypothetical protein
MKKIVKYKCIECDVEDSELEVIVIHFKKYHGKDKPKKV